MLNPKTPGLLYIVLCLGWLCAVPVGCGKAPVPEGAPDYGKAEAWYALGGYPGKPADVFYVYPTATFTSFEDNGKSWNADIQREEVRALAHENQDFNRLLYKDYNFYAPYYRQLILGAYAPEPAQAAQASVEEAAARAAEDVRRAFRYYMEHHNQGRPFFLVGHSQGSQMLLELLKEGMTAAQRRRMVAAYCIGYVLTEAECKAHRLRPASDSCSPGVVVVFNSVTKPQGISPLFAGAQVGINPLNWCTDSTPAPASLHRGLARYNAAHDSLLFIPAQTGGYLHGPFMVCTDLPETYTYLPQLEALFPLGNLHFADSWLFGADVVHNMDCRLRHFRQLYPHRKPKHKHPYYQ